MGRIKAKRQHAGFQGVGISQRVPDKKVRAALATKNAPTGDSGHLWIMVAAFQLSDDLAAKMHASGGADVMLDTENLLSIDGPGCYHCEEPWTPALAAQPCPGDPSRRL